MAGQTTPMGYYNLERMLKILASKKGKIGVCGTCMDGRGIKPEALVEGAHRSTMDELAVRPYRVAYPEVSQLLSVRYVHAEVVGSHVHRA